MRSQSHNKKRSSLSNRHEIIYLDLDLIFHFQKLQLRCQETFLKSSSRYEMQNLFSSERQCTYTFVCLLLFLEIVQLSFSVQIFQRIVIAMGNYVEQDTISRWNEPLLDILDLCLLRRVHRDVGIEFQGLTEQCVSTTNTLEFHVTHEIPIVL